jgi:hypothetical protein
MLAAPGVIISLSLLWLPSAGWNLVYLRCLFLAFSMSGIGFIVIFEWDAIFPDRRDYQVLFPLPVPMWKLFLAKATAFLLFLAMFLAAINGIATLFWPVLFDDGNFLPVMATHLLAVTAAGLFAAFAAASIRGLLMVLVPTKVFRPASTCVQAILMTVMVTLFLLSSLISDQIRPMVSGYAGVAGWIPAYLFSGLYEMLRPAVRSQALLDLGKPALSALGYAAALFALTHIPLYLKLTRKLVDPPPSNPSGPGTLHTSLNAALNRSLLKNPVQEAVYRYIGQTIARSTKHRMFLSVYAGFGSALVIMTLAPFIVVRPGVYVLPVASGSARAALMSVPLTLSFVLVSGLRAAFNSPAELTANWSFQMTGVNQTGQCLIAMRKWILVCGVIPLFLLLTPFSVGFFSWLVAAFQFVYGLMLSLFLIEALFIDFTKIPFTCGHFPGRSNLLWLVTAYVISLILYTSFMADFEVWLMERPLAAAAFCVAGVLVCLTIRKRRGYTGSQETLDYIGDDDPAVRTLGLLY